MTIFPGLWKLINRDVVNNQQPSVTFVKTNIFTENHTSIVQEAKIGEEKRKPVKLNLDTKYIIKESE